MLFHKDYFIYGMATGIASFGLGLTMYMKYHSYKDQLNKDDTLVKDDIPAYSREYDVYNNYESMNAIIQQHVDEKQQYEMMLDLLKKENKELRIAIESQNDTQSYDISKVDKYDITPMIQEPNPMQRQIQKTFSRDITRSSVNPQDIMDEVVREMPNTFTNGEHSIEHT